MTAPEACAAELQDILRQLHEIDQYRNRYGLVFYSPIGNQGKFHSSLKTVRLVLGSNRSGKTASGTVEAIAHAIGYRPWLDPKDPNYKVRMPDGSDIPVPNVGRIVAENYQVSIVQTIFPSIQDWGRGLLANVKRDQRGVPVKITFFNGSVIHLMSYDQDDMAFEGTKGHWAWFDEPPPYQKYIAVKRGLVDYGGRVWLTMTPISQPWINDVIVARAGDPDSGVDIFKYSIWDNARSRGGYLPDEAIQEFLKDLRQDELEARLHGNFLHLAGRVFKTWNPEPPYWVPPYHLPAHWPRVCVIDPHPRKPIAVTWICVNPDNQAIVYRDMFDEKLGTVSQVARAMRKAEGWAIHDHEDGTWSARRTDATEAVVLYIIDTSGNTPEKTSGETTAQRFIGFGINVVNAYKLDMDAGIDMIHQALQVRGEWGEPGLIVFNTCRWVKDNFLFYCYDDWRTSRDRDLREEKQTPRKTHDDHVTGIRYFFQKRLTYSMLKGMYTKWCMGQDLETIHIGSTGHVVHAVREPAPRPGRAHSVPGYPGLTLRGR